MHKSVLLLESIENLNLSVGSVFVDCTLGYGGHSSEILHRIPNGFLYAFDQDTEALQSSQKRLEMIANNYELIYSNFSHMKEELAIRGIEKVNGILFDLGVSSPQLDEDYRGFSFHSDARLDMRMNQEESLSAYEVVNSYSFENLVRIFTEYGEEKYASSIAKNIIKKRMESPIETTLELVEVIKCSVPMKYKLEKHPARKVFQAIRIEVNHELEVFETALYQALDLLDVGGRICVITFHSLEDKLCKRIFKEASSVDRHLQKMPVIPEEFMPKFKVVNVIYPTQQEIEENYRARSAKLRVIERIKEG